MNGHSFTFSKEGAVMSVAKHTCNLLLSGVMAFSMVPTVALAAPSSQDVDESILSEEQAQDAESFVTATDRFASSDIAVVSCANGWSLTYTVDETGAAITGVAADGTGELVIPDAIEGATVYAVGKKAFFENTSVGKVHLPSGLTYLAPQAFQSSTVSEINIPASVENVPFYAFRSCTSLKSINFEGETIQFLGWGAFQGCSALESIDIPLLTAYPTREYAQKEGLEKVYNANACINMYCFEGCSNLKEIICEGPVVQDPKSYFAGTSCLSNAYSGMKIVCKCATVSIPSGTGGASYVLVKDFYYTVDFYGNEDDAAKLNDRLGSVTYKAIERTTNSSNNLVSNYVTRTVPIMYNKEDATYRYSESLNEQAPTAPEGKVWGIADHTLASAYDYFNGSAQAIAVDPENLDYGWVSSPSIQKYYEGTLPTTSSGMGSSTYPTLQVQADGSIPELDQIVACAADGSALDSSAFTLEWQKGYTTIREGYRGTMSYETTYKDCTKDDVTSAGYYMVRAVGTGEYADASTEWQTFYLEKPCPDTTLYLRDSVSEYIGNTVYAAAALMENTPAFNVILPSNDWRNQLLGAGFAGAGNGLMMYDCQDDYNSKMMEGCMLTKSSRYIILETQQQVPQSAVATDEKYLADYVAERAGENGTRYGKDSTTAQELSNAAISKFKAKNWSAAWGTTAIVASSTKELITESAAQVAYANASRVFFLQDDGTLNASDLELLKADGITDIMLIGDTSCVSSAVEQQITSSTGKSVSRILEGTNATQASIALAKDLVGAGSNTYDTIVVADATNPVNVSAGALYAARANGVLITCSTSADAKAIEDEFADLIAQYGLDETSTLAVVGSFDYLEGSADTYFKSAWVDPVSTEVTVGDTFENAGYLYKITDASTAQVVGLTGGAVLSQAPRSVTYGETTYTVNGVALDLTCASVSKIADQTATGEALTPEVSVTYAGQVLTEGTDYKVSYADNVEPGTATVTITGEGNYFGTLETTFTIEEAQSSDPVEAFAQRLYKNILGRSADAEGLATQVDALRNGTAPAEIAYNYFNSAEYFSKGETAEQTVERVYQVMFGRASDKDGKAFWAGKMNDGMSVRAVIAGFSQAQEYKNYFSKIGLNNDEIPVYSGSADKAWDAKGNEIYSGGNSRDLNQGATAFAKRMYTEVLSRDAEIAGLNVQAGAIANGTACYQIALNFFDGQEFTNKKYNNSKIVSVAYQAILGRAGSSSEVSAWAARMQDSGMSVSELVYGFCQSDEFEAICQSYGLTSGAR